MKKSNTTDVPNEDLAPKAQAFFCARHEFLAAVIVAGWDFPGSIPRWWTSPLQFYWWLCSLAQWHALHAQPLIELGLAYDLAANTLIQACTEVQDLDEGEYTCRT